MSQASEAQRALVYTQRLLGRLPSNHPDQGEAASEAGLVCVSDARDRYRRLRDSDLIMNIRRKAAAAKRAHCGFCGEYAAVVFDFLMLTGCQYPLEHASYVDPGDHSFVIIGRPGGTNESDPNTWGANVVVCDAWAGRVVWSRSYWSDMPPYPHRVHAPKVDVRWPIRGDYPSARTTGIPA